MMSHWQSIVEPDICLCPSVHWSNYVSECLLGFTDAKNTTWKSSHRYSDSGAGQPGVTVEGKVSDFSGKDPQRLSCSLLRADRCAVVEETAQVVQLGILYFVLLS